MRGNEKARIALDKHLGFHISVITYMELVQGMRNKEELQELRKALKEWNSNILFISEVISAKALFFIERYYLSHSLELADALIAATAISHGIPILTGNYKHYQMINELEIKRFKH
jgi:hypothetical protein